jgi:hypothetical protein
LWPTLAPESTALVSTKIATGPEVPERPLLSKALAVKTIIPRSQVALGETKRQAGLVAEQVTPEKNWTFVTLPLVLEALAWMVTLAGAAKAALFTGLVILIEGGTAGGLVTLIVPVMP